MDEGIERTCYVCNKKYEATRRQIQPGDEYVCPSCEPRIKALQYASVQQALALLGRGRD